MSGLFTRLARQAAGQPRNPVRAALSMTYQPAPDSLPAEPDRPVAGLAPDSIKNSPRSGLDGSLSPRFVAQTPVSAADDTALVSGADKTPGRSSGRGIESIETDRSAASTPSDGSGEPVCQRLTAPALPAVTDAQVLQQHEPADTPLSPSARASEAMPATRRNEPPLVAESSHYQQPSRQTSPSPGPGRPELLLPSLASQPPTSSATAAQMPPVASPLSSEVHVHIGRIEVTALQPEAAPKSKPRTTRQPMSLDDYLARRRQN